MPEEQHQQPLAYYMLPADNPLRALNILREAVVSQQMREAPA